LLKVFLMLGTPCLSNSSLNILQKNLPYVQDKK
jgi:hypothetical protein